MWSCESGYPSPLLIPCALYTGVSWADWNRVSVCPFICSSDESDECLDSNTFAWLSDTLWASLWVSLWRICLQCERPGFDPWVGKLPWRRERLSTQYSGLENSMDCIVHGVAKSRTWLSNFHFTSNSLWPCFLNKHIPTWLAYWENRFLAGRCQESEHWVWALPAWALWAICVSPDFHCSPK